MNDGFRVLIVEDDEVDAERARRLIASSETVAHVERTRNGWEAIEYLRSAAAHGTLPDLILADEVMPRMGGWELLKELKSEPALAALPVYMLTTWSVEGAVEKSYQLGAVGHVSKTDDQAALAEAITAILRRHCPSAV